MQRSLRPAYSVHVRSFEVTPDAAFILRRLMRARSQRTAARVGTSLA
jgi:hypothetical protein